MKFFICSLTFLLFTSYECAAKDDIYLEYGIGASKLFSFNSESNKTLKRYSMAPSLKLLIGSRLNKARTVSFELGFSYNGEMSSEDATFNSQSFFAGLKLSTNPMNTYSVFARTGAGKTDSTITIKGQADTSNQSTHYYGAAGISFRFDPKRSAALEIQHINDATSDEGINGVFLSFNQFI
ncbi:MAG: outer membrane beta-barrel protein [Bermanella sp.]